jgi:hypothetical protein
VNHSSIPNCNVSLNGKDIFLISNNVIDYNEEITVNYLEVAQLINLPESKYDEYGIEDFDYKKVVDNISKPTLF